MKNFKKGEFMIRYLCLFVLLGVLLVPTAEGVSRSEPYVIYENTDFEYCIKYPASYEAFLVTSEGKNTGVILQREEGTITVYAVPSAVVSEYRARGTEEVFISDYGVPGYKVYGQMPAQIDDPIYCFSPVMLFRQVLADKGNVLLQDLNQIAESFKFTYSTQEVFGENDNMETFLVRKDKSFRIELPANPTTGFAWEFDGLDLTAFAVINSGYAAPPTNLIGGGGTNWWVISPLKAGNYGIRLLYRRPWEEKDQAIKDYRLDFIVK
ncbi:MAG: protease inhibitor I42 family protein [Candidatus Saganbacteria bacterium]|nr:protease inhibitor I42 family protein [Candidatus Saganbacteria bacterium]